MHVRVLVRIHVSHADSRAEQHLNLRARFLLDLGFRDRSSQQSRRKLPGFQKAAVVSYEMRNPLRRRDRFPLDEIQMAPDIEPRFRAGRFDGILERRAVGEQRRAGNDPAPAGFHNRPVHAPRVPKIVRIDNQPLQRSSPVTQTPIISRLALDRRDWRKVEESYFS